MANFWSREAKLVLSKEELAATLLLAIFKNLMGQTKAKNGRNVSNKEMNNWSSFGWRVAEVAGVFILRFGEENKSLT